MLELIKYSLKNIIGRKTRSLLTILSIFLTPLAIFIFASFGIGLYAYVESVAETSGLDKFMVQARGVGAPGLDDTFSLDSSDLRTVERTIGVAEATAWYVKSGQIEFRDTKKYVFLAGILPERKDIALVEQVMGVEVIEGKQLKKGDLGKVVLGYNYQIPDRIFPEPVQVRDRITINGERFEVIGFYAEVGNPSDDANVYLIEGDMKRLFGGDVGYGAIMGSVFDASEIDPVIARVEKNLRSNRDLEEGKEDFFVQSFADAIEMFKNVINIVVGFIFVIVIISAVVASVNTANTMVTSVLERVREIGVMKAMGARNEAIRNIFLFESGFLGLVAGVLGVLVGWGISFIGGIILDRLGWGFLSPVFYWWLHAFCIGIAVGVGAVSGMFPAVYASRQKPVDALRYE